MPNKSRNSKYKEVSGFEPKIRVLQTLALPFGYTSMFALAAATAQTLVKTSAVLRCAAANPSSSDRLPSILGHKPDPTLAQMHRSYVQYLHGSAPSIGN